MKKILSIIMAFVMILSLGVATFAAEDTGSITISNATKDQTYTIYKIFDASIKLDAEGDAEAVSYSIKTDSQFFAPMFGADGKTANDYFDYESSTGAVTKDKNADNTALINYLTDLVKSGSYTAAATPIKATSAEVKFEDLPYGYYVVVSSLGATVTINSNTPDVEVIDKNQIPGVDFEKKVQVGVDEKGEPVWADSNSASISDLITYKISFTATNYDADKKIKYYQIHDEKGEAIWAEFNSIKVFVGGVELKRGYYLSQGGINTNNWEYFGDWGTTEKNRNNAEWYLVHLGYDQFRITIPWLENHTLSDVTDPNSGSVVSHSLNFPGNATSKFASPTEVVVTYNATIEPNATIGGGSNSNLFNKASGSWTSEYETGATPPDTVETTVYGIGLLKDDASTGKNLAGAEFRIFKNYDPITKEYSNPVYVIPTDIKGVYIVDSLNTHGEGVSGAHMDTSRKLYKDYLEGYLGAGYETKQDNLVVSQANGKLVVLGLNKGTYYLQEVKAPDGYNSLSIPVELVAGEGTKLFTVFADKDGNVADIQTDDGIHHGYEYNLTSTIVHNSKGVQLPSTGGQGTMWLISIGTLLAIGFAIFLITHKKMSIYVD